MISGLGVAYLSLHALKLELAANEIAVIDIIGFPLRRVWYAVRSKGKWLNNGARAFLEYLLNESDQRVAKPNQV